jgi:hypothetical protein
VSSEVIRWPLGVARPRRLSGRLSGCSGGGTARSRLPRRNVPWQQIAFVYSGGQGNCCSKAARQESPRVDALVRQRPCDRSVRTRDSDASRTEHPLSSWEQEEPRVRQTTFGWNETAARVAPRDNDIDRFRPSASADGKRASKDAGTARCSTLTWHPVCWDLPDSSSVPHPQDGLPLGDLLHCSS